MREGFRGGPPPEERMRKHINTPEAAPQPEKLPEKVREEIPHLWRLLRARIMVDPGGDIRRVDAGQADEPLPYTKAERERLDAVVVEALEKNQVPEVIFSAKFHGTMADHCTMAFKREDQHADWQALAKGAIESFERKLGANPCIRFMPFVGRGAVNIYECSSDPRMVIVQGNIGSSGTDSSGRQGQAGMQMLLARDSELYRMLTSGDEKDLEFFYRASRHVAAVLRPDARALLTVVYPDAHPSILNLAVPEPTIVDMASPVGERKAMQGDARFSAMLHRLRRARPSDEKRVTDVLSVNIEDETRGPNKVTLDRANAKKYFEYRTGDGVVPAANAPVEKPAERIPLNLEGVEWGKKKKTQPAPEVTARPLVPDATVDAPVTATESAPAAAPKKAAWGMWPHQQRRLGKPPEEK